MVLREHHMDPPVVLIKALGTNGLSSHKASVGAWIERAAREGERKGAQLQSNQAGASLAQLA